MSQGPNPRLYSTWGPIMGALVIVLALSGLYLYHQQQYTLATDILQQLNRANEDLSRGYLHLALADAPDSPWQQSTGRILMDQAFHHYERVLAGVESHRHYPQAADPQPLSEQLASFRGETRRIQALLAGGAADPDSALQLRLSIYNLTEQAHALELRLRTQLEQALHYQDRTFYAALLVGLLLLAAFFWVNWWASRRQEESESRFRQLTDTISEVFWLTDLTKNTILYVSPAYEKIWGRSRRSLLDSPGSWLEAIHPDDRPRVEAAQALQAQGRYRETYRIIRPDGELRWVEDRAFPVLDGDGNVYRLAGLATDITDFKRIEMRLKQQESLLKQASRLARFGAWQVDAITRRIYLSDEVSHILERPPGKPFPLEEGLAMYPTKWREVVTRAVQACMDTGEDYELEVQMETASGRLRWVHIQGRAVRDHTGRVIRLEGSFQDITEQKNIATLLSQGGGHRFQQLADALPFIIWSAQPDGTIDYANSLFSRYTGLAVDEAISLQRWLDTIHPDDRHRAFYHWRDAIGSGAEYLAEFRLRRRDGDYHWHLARAVPVRDHSGEILLWYGTAMDIHDRKLTEERARHLAERLATTLESITDAFYTLDAQWRFTYVNREAERLLRRERTELLGANVWEAFPEARGSDIEHHYRRAVTEQRKTAFETWFAPLETWFSVNAYPSREGLAVYFQDVTARRREQEQMRLLQTCIDHMNDVVLITEAEPQDEPGPRILYANPAFERITGYTLAEVLGKTPRLLQGPRTQRRELDRVRAAMRQWQPVRAELINYTKSGEEFWLEMELVPLADDQGWYTHWVAVERDITERKRIAELEQSQRVAELASEAKSRFLASMSHEIRTPINGVIGMVDVLHQTSLQGHQVEMVDIIRESATSLLTLIEDILDFSKIEAGRLELESHPLSPAELLRKTCLLLDRMAEQHHVELTLFSDPALPAQVVGDELRLKQILLNLVTNAIKFSGNRDTLGRVSVRAHLLAQEQDSVRVEFRIRDNGIGMDEDTQQRLFSPFMQADASTTRHYGGTGLGLSITHSLVDMMQGQIHVSSEPGKGSEFRVQLSLPVGATEGDRDSLPDIRGVACVLVGRAPLMDDLARYLDAAGAEVQVFDPEHPEPLAAPGPPAPWVWVADTGEGEPAPPDLGAECPAHHRGNVHWLLLGRGHRRQPRTGEQQVQIDLNCLDREGFIHALALAAGRVSLVGREGQASGRQQRREPPSRLQALEQGKLILVAEDNTTNQNVIRHQLGQLGYAADMADNGEQALHLWQKGHYALLLTDLHMPTMDGYELTRRIREREAEQQDESKPIIALTANADVSETERCRALGMNDYLTKPIALNILGATLAQWVEPVQVPAPITATPALSADDGTLLDLRVLTELVGKDPGVLREFLQDFQRDAERLRTQLRDALAEGDLAQVSLLAHTLKSSSRAVGAGAMGERCAQLERLAKSADTEGLQAAMQVFLPEMDNLITHIRRYYE